ERIRSTFQKKGFDKLSISIGVITYTEKLSSKSFIQFADSCMYDAKRAGGNRIVVYKPEHYIRNEKDNLGLLK
ncbi:MAG: diguanylate cyclase, partial [Candidatus Hydrogenedentes bacterium]|nr:diguanylate cyclase [Candidatus Hydrogenedentota bacterium]